MEDNSIKSLKYPMAKNFPYFYLILSYSLILLKN